MNNTLNFKLVKNRGGLRDLVIPVRFDFEKMSIYAPELEQ